MTPSRLTTTLALLATLLVAPTETHAASLDETIATLFDGGGQTDDHPSAALLERVGVTYQGYAFAERLPTTGSYLVDTRLRWREQVLRFPVKLRPDGDGWSVDWMPDRAYTEALVSLLDSGDVVALSDAAGGKWADQTAMPELPVILSEQGATTPFGPVPLADRDELQPSKPFGRHVGRWVSEVLENDPAPAGLAILARGSTPWDRLSQVLLTAAGAGFFRIHLVARATDGGDLVAQPALAPVFESGGGPAQSKSLIVAMSDDTGRRFRISVGDRLLETPDGCDGDVSLCLAEGDAFAAQLGARLTSAFPDGPPSIAHVLFAADGATPLQAALERAIDVPGALGIPPAKLYLGHTQ